MSDDIKVLTFQPDLSGFFRLAVELPSGNTRQTVTVAGSDRGNDFIISDNVIICSSIYVDSYPNLILIDDDNNLSHEKIKIKFDTYGFTPTGIYATLGIVKGDNCFQSLIHDENKITDFKWANYGEKNQFTFEFPQNGKLSDLFNIENLDSSSQPLIVILEMKESNYSVNNHKQLSSSNLINNFSTPVKFIRNDDYKIVMDSILGDENIAGLINFRLLLRKDRSFGIIDSSSTIVEDNNPDETNIIFSGYNNRFLDFLSTSLSRKYISNKEFGLLKSGSLYIHDKEKPKLFTIKSSRRNQSSNGESTLTIDGHIKKYMFNNDGTMKTIIVTDFLPLSYRIRSDRDDYEESKSLKIKSISNSSIEYEPIFAGGSILDDGDLYIELIDKTNSTSAVKNIGPNEENRSKVLTSTTSDISDAYFVSSTFYEKFDSNRSIFWKPILPATDGTVGMSNDLGIVYIRLESNRPIDRIQGFLALGGNVMDIILEGETGNPSNNGEQVSNTFIFNKDNNVAYIVIDFDKVVPTVIEKNLLITSDIKVIDDNGNTFTIRF